MNAEAVFDVRYIDKVKPLIAKLNLSSYLEALTWTHGEFCTLWLFV